jgi:hypothetical protein
LTVVGTLITIVFGLTASTRSSLREFRSAVIPRRDQITATLDEMADTLLAISRTLDERLPRSSTT